MQIYLEGCCLYGFNQQKAFGARYMAGNLSISRDYRKNNENDIKYNDNMVIKS